jgi:hypothetical protein
VEGWVRGCGTSSPPPPPPTAQSQVTAQPSAAHPQPYGTPGAGRFAYQPIRAASNTFYADPVNGNDANNGTEAFPVKTIEAGLALARAAPGTDTLVLRAGTFYQTATIVLTTADSGLTIQAMPGEPVWISGAAPLTNVTWAPYNVTPGDVWAVYNNTNGIFGDVPSPGVVYNGTYTSWQGCQASCQADNAAGGPCAEWVWHDANTGSYALQCYFRIDGVWVPTPEADHVTGRLQVREWGWGCEVQALGDVAGSVRGEGGGDGGACARR